MVALDSLVGRSLLATSIVGSVWLAAPDPARACSPAYGIWATEPDTGEALPTNSRLFLSGYFELQDVVLTVDDQPATLVLDPDHPSRAFTGDAYRIEPAPPEGASVALRVCFGRGDDGECTEQSEPLSWTVTAADATAPAPARELEVGIYDHADIDTAGDSCSSGEVLDATMYVHVDVDAEDGTGAARQARIEVLDAEDDRVLGSSLVAIEDAGGRLDSTISFEPGALRRPLDGSVCVRVTVLDLAGNRAEAISSCEPDHVGVDADQGTVSEPFVPDEPDWDQLPGEEPLERGCACSTERAPSGLASTLLLGLAGLGLHVRRRRARQRRS